MRTLALAVVVAAFAVATPALAAIPCLTGVPAATDATDIAGVRGRVDVACPCATFDGSGPTKNHAAYLRCAAPVIRDAADGTPILGLFGLRPECRGKVRAILRQADCGYPPAEARHPCCRHMVASGKNNGAIRRAARCASTTGTVQHVCLGSHAVFDACSNDATNTCRPACGDGVKNGSEQCDGSDATACPGLCGSDCTCPSVQQTTVSIPSGAMPVHTPGSLGVTVTNAKLLAQFGGPSFSLDNATYTRYAMNRPGGTPDAILVLVPGFEGGASSFRILAQNLITRALGDGLVAEVWAFDRRGHQLEDRAGLDVAEQFLVSPIALDWLYGGELGLTLHPALVAGPNRRAVFYDAQADVPFMADWTSLVFSRDIDAVVAAADAAVRNHNVFLGGHSAGTGFTARYAATDFNLSGVGPADPGYAKVRGLVLLEGPGGSTAGAPLTADTLDRIIAKYDGGLFGAVRDNAGRCVNGTTACTVANEATACVGQVPPKCTLATTAFSTQAILNPRILASLEVAGIQGATDPDTGEQILGVDQGAPGNRAVAVVPDLAILNNQALFPPGTVEASIAAFIDDDGPVAAFAFFVASSVGAPGPVVGGLHTWLDITEGPLPPAVLPNNGPPPTSLPATVWGQEVEPSRFDRMMPSFYEGGTNFTDWYYPSAGLSTTSVTGVCASGTCTVGNVGASCSVAADCSQAINLDSTALSVGRSRRDIENLTQAPNVNVPVIAFGASNGLTPVPGAYIPFAQSIGTCTAPTCDGTPRIVDAANPNPAFPTFGNVNGGFEVYISEGYSHVDIVVAEDDATNHVVAPLAAFLERNTQ
jgi:pimeloyl-ACP methyl ester carboxylesterase